VLEPLQLDTVPLSNKEVDYPAIREMHAASTLHQEAEAATWHGRTPPQDWPAPTGELFPLRPLSADEAPTDTIEQVILRRARSPIRSGPYQLCAVVDPPVAGDRRHSADFRPPGAMLNDLYLTMPWTICPAALCLPASSPRAGVAPGVVTFAVTRAILASCRRSQRMRVWMCFS
jgi:hypothetical protein